MRGLFAVQVCSLGVLFESFFRQLDGVNGVEIMNLQSQRRFQCILVAINGQYGSWRLPLILARRLVKDILLIVDGQNAIFHNTLPRKGLV